MKIELITERVHNSNVCSICYEDIENKTITQCCQNSFCFKCIHIWLSKRAVCPLCKNKLLSSEMFVVASDGASTSQIEEEPIDENSFNEKFDKYKNLDILLRQKKGTGAKILIFSNYENTFANIIPILQQNEMKFDFIKGNGNVIKCIVDRYKNGSTDVLLVNGSSYGSGLNLENTDTLICFHKMDDILSNQVLGRAQRYGRTSPLNVHYLLYENEIRA